VTLQQLKSYRSRFTLVEMLVVIVVIMILAALLIPAFQQARAKARMTSCTNNLKQFAIGMISYKDDHDEQMVSWLSHLRTDYVPSDDVYICPQDTSSGYDGGRPGGAGDIVQENILKADGTELGDDFPETDDTSRNVERTADRLANLDIERCSYMYEFVNAPCSWLPGDESWGERKVEQLLNGYGKKFNDSDPSSYFDDDDPWEETYFPTIRCFYHTDALWGKRELVLNISYAGNFFLSKYRWEDGVY
jgi:type II secretory pathway pseudopilin PulG